MSVMIRSIAADRATIPPAAVGAPIAASRSSSAEGTSAGDILLDAPRVPGLRSASPAEFGGPGDRWSPETLLVGAVADCFVLTFRAVARASKLSWTSLQCDVTGHLDRIDRVTQFTSVDIHAHL